MTSVTAAAISLAPDAPPGWRYDRWPALPDNCLVVVSGHFDADWERAALRTADAAGSALLSIRAANGEVLLGPMRPAATPAPQPVTGAQRPSYGCAGCARVRDQAAMSVPAAAGGLGPVVEAYLSALPAVPLAPGELAVIRSDGAISRHQVARASACQVCARPAEPATGRPAARPGLASLPSRPAEGRLPVRGSPPFGLDPVLMRRVMADRRYGPVVRVRRKGRAPFAMTEAAVLGQPHAGFGRGRTFRSADAIAILEAWERAGSTPRDSLVVSQVSRLALGADAMDPAGLGRYTERQLAAPGCQLRAYQPDVATDWVWSHRLSDGVPKLVPAEIGFYRYAYPPDPLSGEPRQPCFEDSSSGSALGGSYTEAVLHALIELAERDAFLLAWHQAVPRPRIDLAAIDDAQCRMLIDLISDQGYDLHLLVATADIQIPVTWALAVRRDLGFPAAFSTAGASPDPVEAIRSALWELGHLVCAGQQLDLAQARRLSADPWRIVRLDDHVLFNALPEAAPRVLRVLGGPLLAPHEAFPGWPQRLIDDAGADVTGSLRYLAGAFAEAGLGEILVVDQSSREHAELGLTAVKAIVPGIVPMCFGHARQRLAGLPRLAQAIRQAGHCVEEAGFPFDPHPFP